MYLFVSVVTAVFQSGCDSEN